MRQFKIVVETSGEKPGEDICFMALESGILLIGRGLPFDVFYDYCSSRKIDKNEQKAFARGWYQEGQLVFPDETPGWKRDEIREFLAGQALQMAIANREREMRALRRLADAPLRFRVL